jgi:cell division protein FtsN
MGFYALGLKLSRGPEKETIGLSIPAPFPGGKSKTDVPDPRRELDFINNSELAPGRDYTPGPTPSVGTPVAGAEGRQSLEIGPFDSEQGARGVAVELQRHNFLARVQRGPQSGWRLFIGPFSGSADADAAIRTLRDLGYTPQIRPE